MKTRLTQALVAVATAVTITVVGGFASSTAPATLPDSRDRAHAPAAPRDELGMDSMDGQMRSMHGRMMQDPQMRVMHRQVMQDERMPCMHDEMRHQESASGPTTETV